MKWKSVLETRGLLNLGSIEEEFMEVVAFKPDLEVRWV